jgi:hypothetical protein
MNLMPDPRAEIQVAGLLRRLRPGRMRGHPGRGREGQAGGDQRPVRFLPGRAWPSLSALAAFAKAFAVTHLTEDGVDRGFIQVQVGHECDSSTAIYTSATIS